MATARKPKAPGQRTPPQQAPAYGATAATLPSEDAAPATPRRHFTSLTPVASLAQFAGGHPSEVIGRSRIVLADCFDWLATIPENSLHAIITDPPYGVKEYEADQMAKRAGGRGGVWRIPPAFDGHTRAPLPRFTALNEQERAKLHGFFVDWARLATRALRPGAQVFIASNAFLSQFVFSALVEGGLEFRGELIRLVRTLRGGDRPKNAEQEFADVCSLPRGCYEPWGILRKPLPAKMTVSECLRAYQTGGLRRRADGKPFADVILSERTPRRERAIAAHPSLKPQSFMRQIVYASLPLGEGVIADPFMGSGATVAAAEALGAQCVGVERVAEYYTMSQHAIPQLAALAVAQAPDLGLAGDDLSTTNEQQTPKQLQLLLS